MTNHSSDAQTLLSFVGAIKEQEISHIYQTLDNPDYVKSLYRYFYVKARAEQDWTQFTPDPSIEHHLAECESCQRFYDALKKALPVLEILVEHRSQK